MSEALGKLSDGKACLLMDEIRRLKRCWRDLSQRAEELEAQRGEDMQRSVEFQEAVVSVEELFHQVSREWDYLARYQSCSIVRCLFLVFKHCSFHLQMSYPYRTYFFYCFSIYIKFKIIAVKNYVGLYVYRGNCVFLRLCVPRADTESTSEHLEALKKLSSDLEGQRTTLEDLRDQKHAILPRLSLLDKELVKQQVRCDFCSDLPFANVHCKLSISQCFD